MKTKELLAITLQKLMKTENLDKISIKKLTEECGINRQTFYYHFSDIYDLVYWMLDKEGNKLINDSKVLSNPENVVIYLYDYLIANEETILAVYYSLGKTILERYIVDKTQTFLFSLLNNNPKLDHVLKSIKLEVCSFFKYAFVNYAFEWIRNGMSRQDKLSLITKGNVISNCVINTAIDFQRQFDEDNKRGLLS